MELAKVEEPIHTEQIQDILGKPPKWLYRWGISIMLAVAMICILITTLISYPEEVQTRIKLHSTYSPCYVSVKDSGVLAEIFVQNESTINKGDSLAVLENPAGKTIITAPVRGKLTYAGIIHENEQFVPLQHVFLISHENNRFYGEMLIPPNDVYKVEPGQTVIVKLRNSSDEKYGLIQGTIKYITNEQFKSNQYLAEVDFDHSDNETGHLLSNGMITDAEIIIAKASLFYRLVHSLTRGMK